MGRLIKYLFVALAVVIVAVIAVVIAVLTLVEPEDYRELIATTVSEQTGRTLSIEGELGLSFLPCCGITLGQSRLSNPPGFPAGDFASVESARLDVRIWPLLTEREVLIGGIGIDGLELDLLRRADGVANWDFENSAGAEAGDAATTSTTELSDLSVDIVSVRNAAISYVDEPAGLNYRIEDFDLVTGSIKAGEAFDIETSLRLTDRADGTTGEFSLQSGIMLDLAASRAKLSAPRASVKLTGPAVSGADLAATLTARAADLTLSDTTQAALSELAADVSMTGGEWPVDSLSFTSEIQNLAIDATDAVRLALAGIDAQIEAAAADLPGGKLDMQFAGEGLSYAVDSGRGELQPFQTSVDAAGLNANLDGKGRFDADGAELAGRFELAQFSPRDLLATLGEPPPETTDPSVLTALSGTGDWKLGKNALSLQSLLLQLDDTQIKGTTRIRNFDEPRYTIRLRLDKLELDRYLSPAEESEQDSGEKSDDPPVEIPTETLRALNLDGRLRIDDLTFNNTKIADLDTTLNATKGVLTLDPMSAKLYKGKYRGSMRIDASREVPRVSLEQNLDAIQVHGLLADLAEVDQLEGVLAAKLKARGRGRTDRQVLKSLDGTLSLNLAEGVYKGMDIWHEVRSARARLRGDPPPQLTGPAETRITKLDMAGRLSEGILASERIVAEIPFMRINGDGNVNLLNDKLDYRLAARVFETPRFPDGETLDDLTNRTLPLTISGTVDSPKVGVDVGELAKSLATEEVKRKLLDRLGGDEPEPDASNATEGEPQQEQKPRDILKKGLRDLLDR